MPKLLHRCGVLLGVLWAVAGCSEAPATEVAAAPLTAMQRAALEIQPTDRVLGSPAAPVKVVEYASFTCKHCADSHKEIFPLLQQEYVATGKVAFVLRPLPLDNVALAVSKVVRCAPADQHYNFVSAFFNSQTTWLTAPDRLTAIKQIAQLGGMTPTAFDACMQDAASQAEVLEMNRVGREVLQVNSTPTYFVNGERVAGHRPALAFKEILARHLPTAAQ